VNDVDGQVRALERGVARKAGPDGELVSVTIQRRYTAPPEDVWDAITKPERIRRWFLPVRGDLRVRGDFQLEGNAGGRFLECDAPRMLRVTFGGDSSIVELRLLPEDDGATVLEIEHTVPIEMAQSGAGALYVGPGWDGAFTALALHLAGVVIDNPLAAASSLEGQQFSRRAVLAWVATVEASGTASPEEITAATHVAMAQFAPDVTG
jgi:uncharacterized protein YndB with AHSA1/START domain